MKLYKKLDLNSGNKIWFVGWMQIYRQENYHKPKIGIKLLVRPGDWWCIDLVTKKYIYEISFLTARWWHGDKKLWWLIGIGKEDRYGKA